MLALQQVLPSKDYPHSILGHPFKALEHLTWSLVQSSLQLVGRLLMKSGLGWWLWIWYIHLAGTVGGERGRETQLIKPPVH